MKCPKCGAEADYIPQEGFIVGWGYIVCKNKHLTKAYHLVIGLNGSEAEALIFLKKESLEKAINKSGSEKLKKFYKYAKHIHEL